MKGVFSDTTSGVGSLLTSPTWIDLGQLNGRFERGGTRQMLEGLLQGDPVSLWHRLPATTQWKSWQVLLIR